MKLNFSLSIYNCAFRELYSKHFSFIFGPLFKTKYDINAVFWTVHIIQTPYNMNSDHCKIYRLKTLTQLNVQWLLINCTNCTHFTVCTVFTVNTTDFTYSTVITNCDHTLYPHSTISTVITVKFKDWPQSSQICTVIQVNSANSTHLII